MTTRLIPLEGGYNFRDLGGYPARDGGETRMGLVFRSGALGNLTPRDLITLRDLNIRTVIDMREEMEAAHEGEDRLPEGVQHIRLPTTIGREQIRDHLTTDPLSFRMVDYYESSLASSQAYQAELFGNIVRNLDHALVFHCSAGKDRTGITAALLLRLAGVPDEFIIADYAETTRHIIEYSVAFRERFRGFGLPEAPIDEMLASEPATMARFLTYLDTTYGTAEDFLLAGGVSAEQIARFRSRFVQSSEIR